MGFLAGTRRNSLLASIESVLEKAGQKTGWVRGLVLVLIAVVAFATRLFSVIRFESIIHEFDPWFNFRATKYLVEHGWYDFLNWFDERAWYPLGRIVGGTVYPGIMVTSAVFHHVMNNLLQFAIDIRNVCVFLAPFFSGFTAIATYLLTKELKDSAAGLFAAAFIALCPGYISRSVAGSYDNEGIAIFLMMATFYLWIKAVKQGSAWYASLAAMFYYYMVSAWGGYAFIINLIPLHVFVLLLMGRYSARLYTAYCSFYILGTLASMTIPFVGFQPVSTSEHMAAMGMFGLIQLVAFVEIVRGLVDDAHFKRIMKFGVVLTAVVLFVVFVAMSMAGMIAPWTGRFYSLWDTDYARKHIPIIASVSEHQPTTWGSFFFDMHMLLFLFPAGLYLCFRHRRDEHVFAIVYALTASYFAGVMVRLILTLTPIVCVCAALAVSHLLDVYLSSSSRSTQAIDSPDADSRSSHTPKGKPVGTLFFDSRLVVVIPVAVLLMQFVWHCTWVTSSAYSSPSIILASYDREGKQRIVDDFREAYYWLRRNTDEDAKVLAWWDYGYQIAGMADRTTIVDNNTWNNTHIATVGKVLASSETAAYPVLRQLDIDYILVLSGAMSGFSGDDLNKFLWMIRIAEGIYPDEVREADFFTPSGEYRVDNAATQTMKESLLYKMSYYGMQQIMGSNGFDRVRHVSLAGVDPKLTVLDEAYSTENYIIRIFKVKQPDLLGRPLSRASI